MGSLVWQDVLHELQINKLKRRNFAPSPFTMAGLDPKERVYTCHYVPVLWRSLLRIRINLARIQEFAYLRQTLP